MHGFLTESLGDALVGALAAFCLRAARFLLQQRTLLPEH